MVRKKKTSATPKSSKKMSKKKRANTELINRLDELIRAIEANTRQVADLERRLTSFGQCLMPLSESLLKSTAVPVAVTETLIDRAEWLLRELDPKSNKPAKKMAPEDNLKIDLGLTDLNIRALAGSMDVHVKQRNPAEGVTKAEVEKAKTVHGELKVLQKKIEGQEPSDSVADVAIEAAKERL